MPGSSAGMGEENAAPRRLLCRVAALDELTHDIRRLLLASDDGAPFVFAAGQYARLAFADLPPRDYSMANIPGARLLEFHIRRMGPGSVSAHVADRLAPGDRVVAEGPFGEAYLRAAHRGRIFALAGGSGLAPIKSIVETALAADAAREIHLYFGAGSERDIYLEPHFTALAAAHARFRFVPVLSAPDAPTRRRCGMLHEAVAADFADFAGGKAYLAGPPAMIERAAALLAGRLGMAASDIHADPFWSDAEKAARTASV